MNTLSRHDELRDTIARDWQTALDTGHKPVLSMTCECGNSVSDLPRGGAMVKTEYTWRRKRPDIAILDADNVPVRFGEVIDHGPPSKDLLAIYQQSCIPVVFIPYSEGSMVGYCSVIVGRVEEGRKNTAVHSWGIASTRMKAESKPSRYYGARLAVFGLRKMKPSWIAKGFYAPRPWGRHYQPVLLGTRPLRRGARAGRDSTLAELLAYWNSIDFWRFVWEKRVREPGTPYGGPKDESLTSCALQFVVSAISNKQFRMAYEQLLEVGRSPMTAFESCNCHAAASCWRQLEAHAESLLPSDSETTRRPDDWER